MPDSHFPYFCTPGIVLPNNIQDTGYGSEDLQSPGSLTKWMTTPTPPLVTEHEEGWVGKKEKSWNWMWNESIDLEPHLVFLIPENKTSNIWKSLASYKIWPRAGKGDPTGQIPRTSADLLAYFLNYLIFKKKRTPTMWPACMYTYLIPSLLISFHLSRWWLPSLSYKPGNWSSRAQGSKSHVLGSDGPWLSCRHGCTAHMHPSQSD